MITPRAPAMLVSSSGLEIAALAAFSALPAPLGNANAHVGKAGILHDGTDVSKVEVDESGNIDQAGDALNALAQHVIGCFKSVHQSDLFPG